LNDRYQTSEASRPGSGVENDPDVTLVERALQGDMEAFDYLVRKHECRVFRTTLAITGNPADAEEALQDAFLNVYQHLMEFRRDSRFTTWLTRIAINAALHKIRRQKEIISLDDEGSDEGEFQPRHVEDWSANPEELYATEEIRQIVQHAVEKLPPLYRVVFVLRDVTELDTVETAEVLGLTIAAVKTRLLRARLMLRESLAERFARKPGWASSLRRVSWMVRGMMGGRVAHFPRSKGA
jgi:RNA polymerase sigma-70 factor (ECF subfamily)